MRLLILAVAVALAGCKTLENRIVTTMQGDRAYVVSNYGPISFGAELSAEDAAELKRLLKQR